MEKQADETFSEDTMSDEEPNYEYVDCDEGWEDVIEINPDESVSQVSRLSSKALSISTSITESSVWTYFDKNPPDAQGFNVCKKCSKKYKPSTSATILRNHLKKHQISIPIKKHKVIIEKKNPFNKEEQKEHDNHLVQWLICGSQPFTIVDSNYFKKFINFFCPRYVIPNRHKIKGKFHFNN
jgi:hypothetical protein